MFEDALKLILKYEGDYVNNPFDPGGETKYGITKRDYPHLDIPNLTVEQAAIIYRTRYWNAVKGDLLPAGISALVFDSAVNQGPSRAIKFMQRALNVDADGIIGPRTLAAAQRANLRDFSVRFGAERALHYASLPTFSMFGRGWMRRLLDVTTQVNNGTQAQSES